MAVRVQEMAFDISAEIAALCDGQPGIGAVATFIGKVRQSAGDTPLASLSLEHYPGMTEDELTRIEADASARFNLSASCIIHRIGTLLPGDDIVLVITAAPHRHNAIAAVDFLMDYLKSRAPFWKKETTVDGPGHWVDARTSDADALARWQKTDP